jgi:hypothetical protein
MIICILAAVVVFHFSIPVSASQRQETQQACLKCETIARKAAPKYRVARKIHGATRDDLMVYVSIPKDQFDRAHLLALACRLARDFREENLLVQIFDDFNSAKLYQAPWQQEKFAGWQERERSWRATYTRDVSKNQHWIAWYVDSGKTREENIDLCPIKAKD